MAHYAFLDNNFFVTEVITGKDENEDGVDWEQRYGEMRGQVCKRTSYNTVHGVHYDPITRQPSEDQSKAFRKNYAGKGFWYDVYRDAFIPPKPYPSWVFVEETCGWEAPIPKPEDADTILYLWDEPTTSWVVAP